MPHIQSFNKYSAPSSKCIQYPLTISYHYLDKSISYLTRTIITLLTSVLASVPPYSHPILISESRVIVSHPVRTCPSSTQNCSMVLILLRVKDKVLKIACKILQSILSPILVFLWSHFLFLPLCYTPKWLFCSSNVSQKFLRLLHCCSLSLKHSS